MRNFDVAKAWKNGEKARTKNMHTDGKDVYSYWLKIGYTNEKGEKIALDYTASGKFMSMTTSKHVSNVRCFSDKIVKPE